MALINLLFSTVIIKLLTFNASTVGSLATMSATFDRFRDSRLPFRAADDPCFKKPLIFREPARKGSRNNQITPESSTFNNVVVKPPEDEDIPPTFQVESPCTSPTDRVECLNYQNLSDSLKTDINQSIKYDNLTEKMVVDEPKSDKKTPTSENISRKSEIKVLDSAFSSSSEAMHSMTPKDIENLREFVRMDRGLPLTRSMKQKTIDVFREPSVRPKMNRASIIRVQYIQGPKVSPKCKVEGAIPFKLDEERTLARLKRKAEYYKKTEDPMYKFNWGFEMRYQSNKGNPAMPSSFRRSYETYNKPLFYVPKKLELPKRYLWPSTTQRDISYLGLRMDEELIPLQYQKKPAKIKRKMNGKRPPSRKTKRVLRTKQSPKNKKIPWNYGMFQKD